jgi:fatty-acyl-CoA synthase
VGALIWRQTLSDLLRRTAARSPHKMAICCGAVVWTYAQFDHLCSQLAAGFTAQGVRMGDRVAILARNSHAFAAVRFAVARIGAVLVPINFMLNAEEVAHILRHSEARFLCVDCELAPIGREAARHDTSVERLAWLPSEGPTACADDLLRFEDLLLETASPSAPDFDGSMPAQIVYTSGTESTPKGAVLTHEALIWEYVSCLVDAEIAAEDLVLHALPFYHCAQLDVFLGPSIYVGATNIITSRPVPENLLPLLERHRITSFFAPPTVWISLLRSPLLERSDLSNLRKGYYGASIMPTEVLRELQKRLPQLRLWNLYGQTEIAPVATVLKPEDQLRKPGSAGRPALNVETRIVNESGADVAVGEVGEILHRSPQLMRGYYHDDERTKAAFEGDWFRSGDLGTLDDEGYITIVDRRKDMIKSGGENVSSREVEETIYGLAQVSEVAVIGLPHPLWIEAVTAVVVLRSGHTLTADQLRTHCAVHLASFKVPKRVLFIDSLPKNPSGKVLKRQLRESYSNLMQDHQPRG